MDRKEEHIILSILSLKGIGPGFIGRNIMKIREAIDQLWTLEELMVACYRANFTVDDLRHAEDLAERALEASRKAGLNTIHILSDDYPEKLVEPGIKWPILFTRGSVDLQKMMVGIIGARNSTTIGEKIAQRLGGHFAESGYCIVNGAARGIDAAATSVSLTLENTLAVLPGGLAFDKSSILTKEYREEGERILSGGGGLISSYLPDQKQDQFKLSDYCKLQAALSDGLILVQSRRDGGSRFTLGGFAKLKRPLGIVDASRLEPDEVESYSANDLILEKGKEALTEICKVKPNKIATNIFPIRGKDDYSTFARRMSNPGKAGRLF